MSCPGRLGHRHLRIIKSADAKLGDNAGPTLTLPPSLPPSAAFREAGTSLAQGHVCQPPLRAPRRPKDTVQPKLVPYPPPRNTLLLPSPAGLPWVEQCWCNDVSTQTGASDCPLNEISTYIIYMKIRDAQEALCGP